ncbi:hypothetical protein B0H10DRAFT_1976482, partial [Mycena sp. CBHHK59/15]
MWGYRLLSHESDSTQRQLVPGVYSCCFLFDHHRSFRPPSLHVFGPLNALKLCVGALVCTVPAALHCMSKSRSVTPTPNIYFPTNISPPSDPTPSRIPPHDPTTASGESESPQQTSPTHFTHFHSFVSTQTSPDDHLIHRRPSPDSPPMAKRMRRHSPEDASRSQSSDSQSGMADTEEPEGMSPYSEASPHPVAPLKKKRTRTLTTPHQSAVLHALLAQSRFPTTAMREEVGRSIGLSARKVQIWFQNQRQKARRPGSQGDTSQSQSHSGPQQYSAFPNAPSYAGPAEHQMERDGRAVPHAYSGYPPSEQFLGSEPAQPQLLGPGMPGRSTSQRGRPVLHLSSPDLPAPPYSSRSLPAPRWLDTENPEGTFPFRRGHIHDPSRTLPPLNFNQHHLSSRRLYSSPGLYDSSFMLARSAPTTPSHATFLTSPPRRRPSLTTSPSTRPPTRRPTTRSPPRRSGSRRRSRCSRSRSGTPARIPPRGRAPAARTPHATARPRRRRATSRSPPRRRRTATPRASGPRVPRRHVRAAMTLCVRSSCPPQAQRRPPPGPPTPTPPDPLAATP